jgi:hypothetical protein
MKKEEARAADKVIVPVASNHFFKSKNSKPHNHITLYNFINCIYLFTQFR